MPHAPLLLLALALARPDQGRDLPADCDPAHTQAETVIAIDPDDPLHFVVACMDWGGVAQVVKHAVTFDGGATFECARLDLDTGFAIHADPELVFDASGGVLLFYLAAFGPAGNSIRVRRSSDGGQTFGAPIVVSRFAGDDKPKAALCRAAVAHQDRVAVTWTRVDSLGNPQRILTAFSDDDGATWSAPKLINDLDAGGDRDAFASDVVFASDGDLFVMFQDLDPREVRIDRSADGGVTWGADVVVAPYVDPPNPLPGFSFDFKPVFALATDTSGGPYDGRLYVVHHTWNAGPPAHADVLLSTSDDDGATWTATIVHPGDAAATDQFYADVAVDPWGGVVMSWLDRRNDPGGATLELFGGRSIDGGATVADLRLSDAPFDPSTDAFGGFFIGHYNSIAAHERLALACWADCRAGADSEDLFVDPWNTGLTASVKAISAASGGSSDLAITPGPNLGGAGYLVLASLSGSSPGFRLDGVTVPLAWDALTEVCLLCANTPGFTGTLGFLAADGSAQATLDTLGPFDPLFAGSTVTCVALFFSPAGDLVHATAPEWIELVP